MKSRRLIFLYFLLLFALILPHPKIIQAQSASSVFGESSLDIKESDSSQEIVSENIGGGLGGYSGTVNASIGLNVRTGPWGKIIGSLRHKSKVTIIGKSGDWYKISYNGKTAYVHSGYINANTPPATSSSSSTGTVNASVGLNVRTGPWGKVIGCLSHKTKVTITGKSGDWYKINYNGKTAYVHSDYINKGSAPAAASSKPKTSTGTVNASVGLNVRTGPWGKVIGCLNHGTKVTITGKSGDWYKINYNGKTAYVHSDYINKGSAPAASSKPKTSTGTVNASVGLNVRTGPWGKVIGCLSHGTKVTITGKSGDWYKINYNGKTAYVHSSYISKGGVSSQPSPVTSSGGKTILSVPKQCQGNVKCPYPWSACGPTSLGMALAYYNKRNPGTMAADLWYKCGSTGSAGTGHAGLIRGAKAYGFPNAKFSYSVGLSWLRTQIKAGKPVVANVAHHYVVVTGVDDKGNIYYNDPAKYGVSQVRSYASFSAWWNGGGCYHSAMVLE